MATTGAFAPHQQLTYLIGNAAAVQIPTQSSGAAITSYRVSNVLATRQYLTWAANTATGSAPTISAAAPTNGAPATNTMGMPGGAIEVFMFPANAWFIANAAGAFEITPGDGV